VIGGGFGKQWSSGYSKFGQKLLKEEEFSVLGCKVKPTPVMTIDDLQPQSNHDI
jgi:hypothetical protein